MKQEDSTPNGAREDLAFEYARGGGQTLVVKANSYRGQSYIDVRLHYQPDGPGTPLKPTGKGVTIPFDKANEIADAIKEIALWAQSDEGR